MKRIIDQQQERCIGCRACEVHCKTHHDLGPGPRLCEIVDVGPVLVDGFPRVHFAFMTCRHCDDAPCVLACPTAALTQREMDGIVTLRASRCIGCSACMIACPWGVPQWDATHRKVVKCDHCVDRLDRGLEPACVTGCTTGALRLIDLHEVARRKRRDEAEKQAARTFGPGIEVNLGAS